MRVLVAAVALSVSFSTLIAPVSARAEMLDDAAPQTVGGGSPMIASAEWGSEIHGQVYDSSATPLPNTYLVIDGVEYKSDARGAFRIPNPRGSRSPLLIKRAGYRRLFVQPQSGFVSVRLEPQEIKGVYLQTGHLKSKGATYQNVMELIRTTELNAVVIDVKDDEGIVSQNLKPHIDELHAKGVYVIARLVAFKDNRKPRKNPELAIIDSRTGAPWQDRNKVTYLDPYNRASWDYLITIARAAVFAGVDEIQFDYVRFPTDGNRAVIKWSNPEFTSQTRSAAIGGFLERARKELGALGVFVAADTFGITAYDRNDSGIGQHAETITQFLDYACPMVYPSGYAKGTGGIANPVDSPGAIVQDSVRRYRVRIDEEAVIRPWLQSFRDYAYNRRNYTGADIRAQIDGSEKAGGVGFMLWNAASRYTNAGLEPKPSRKVKP